MALLQQHHPASPLQHMQQLELQIQQALQQLDESQPGLQHAASNCRSSTQRVAAAAARSGCAGQGTTEHYSTALLRRLLDPSWINKVRRICKQQNNCCLSQTVRLPDNHPAHECHLLRCSGLAAAAPAKCSPRQSNNTGSCFIVWSGPAATHMQITEIMS